jgi:hypothetical protein
MVQIFLLAQADFQGSDCGLFGIEIVLGDVQPFLMMGALFQKSRD